MRATPSSRAYNLGSGDGVSVRQIMDAVADVTGIAFAPEVSDRRPGDPPRIVASGELAARDLGWAMRHTLAEMVAVGVAGAAGIRLISRPNIGACAREKVVLASR